MAARFTGFAQRALVSVASRSTVAASPLKRVGMAMTTRAFSAAINVKFVTPSGEEIVVKAQDGDSILDVALEHDIDIEGACGGECACSTCHVILEQDVFDSLEEPDEEEEDMLDLALGLTDTSRLGCQVILDEDLDGIVVTLPAETANMLG